MDNEQRRRTISSIKRLTEVLHRLSPVAQELAKRWQQIAKRLEEEVNHDIDTQVQGFANTLENMTDKQIWRELEEER